jgi:transposase
MDVLYPRCAGLDVHKDSVVAGVRLAGDGPVRTEVRSFDTTTPGLLGLSAWLAEHGCSHIAMEATGVYWRPVWHVLSDGDFALILANAAHVKNVPGRKTDVADALWLADLLAHGLIRPSFVPEAPTQDLRALLRTRKQLVREQASHVQRLQKDAGGRQSQARLRAEPDHGRIRSRHPAGPDRRPQRPGPTARLGAAWRQGTA